MSITSGLEGVVVAETELSAVDGQRGELVVRGHRVEQYAPTHSFEDMFDLLCAPSAAPEETRHLLGRFRAQVSERIDQFTPALRLADPMDSLRAAVATLSLEGIPAPEQTAFVVAAVGVLAAAHIRVHQGSLPVAANSNLPHALDVLRMSTGASPTEPQARALNTYLCTVADHGLNASTFATRVVASTGSDLISAVVAGIGALKGPLHGGAPGPVLDMLDAIASKERADAWIRNELDSGRRIMGMGHRIYRVRDPRAAVLEQELTRLIASQNSARLELGRHVEARAQSILAEKKPTRALRANVEFYTALLLEAVGIPRSHFTTTFAVGRVMGWCAHFNEQVRTGRLIRPASQYIGPPPAARG